MKIRKILTLILMALLFTFSMGAEGIGNIGNGNSSNSGSEIENTWVVDNPPTEVTTIKTNRQKKDGAKLNLEITKLTSKGIYGIIKRDLKEVYFNLENLEEPFTDNDAIFVTEELETFPSVSETIRGKRYSNVMEKYKVAYENKTPVENNGLTHSIVLNEDKDSGTMKKILKVTYENEPQSLFIGILDKKTYELKSVYAWYNAVNLIDPNTHTGYIYYTEKVFSEMIAENVDGTLKYVGKFKDKMNIIRANNSNTVRTDDTSYMTSQYISDFLKVSADVDITKIETVKVYEQIGNPNAPTTSASVDIKVNDSNEKTITLDDGSMFSIKFAIENNEMKLSLVPVIFGVKNNVDLHFDLYLTGEPTAISSNSLSISYPQNISHYGITISSYARDKNTLAPSIKYTFGKEKDDLDKSKNNIIGEPREGWYLGKGNVNNLENYKNYGLKSEGENAHYLFYLIKVINLLEPNLSFKDYITADDSTGISSIEFNEDDKSIIFNYGAGSGTRVMNIGNLGTTINKKLYFKLNDDSITMQVPDWDRTAINHIPQIIVQKGKNKLYSVPIRIELPETHFSEGNIFFQFYSKFEEKFNERNNDAIVTVSPTSQDLAKDYGDVSLISGEWHIPQNLMGAYGFKVDKNRNTSYTPFTMGAGAENAIIDSGTLEDNITIRTRYIFSEDESVDGQNKSGGFGLGFKKDQWDKFLKYRQKITPELSLVNYYGLEIGKYTYDMSVIAKRERTITFDNLSGIPGVDPNADEISTGRIYGISHDRLYSRKVGGIGGEDGGIVGSTLSGEKLRYYGVKNSYYIKVLDESNKPIADGYANPNDADLCILGENVSGNSSYILLGMDDFVPPERMLDTTEKSLYLQFALKNNFWDEYGNGTKFDKTYTIVIEKTKDGEEVYRDKLHLIINKSINKSIKATIYLDNTYKDYFVVDGNYLLNANNNTTVVGSVTYDKNGEGVITPLSNAKYYSVQMDVNQYTENDKPASNLTSENGYSFKRVSYGQTMAEIGIKFRESKSNKSDEGKDEVKKGDFIFFVNLVNSRSFIDFHLQLYDENKNLLQSYDFDFELYQSSENNNKFATLDLNFKDINKLVEKSLISKKPIDFYIKTGKNGITVDGSQTSDILTPIFTQNTTSTYAGLFTPTISKDDKERYKGYTFQENGSFNGYGKFTYFDIGGNIDEGDKISNLTLSDRTNINFGAGISNDPTGNQYDGDVYVEINSFGDNIYPYHTNGNKINLLPEYELALTYLDYMGFGYANSIINLNFPKLTSDDMVITSKDKNKNGLCPKYPYYFGFNSNEILNMDNYSDHAVGVLNVKGGGNPFIFYRAKKVPQVDYHYFFEFESQGGGSSGKGDVSKNGNSWVVTYKKGDNNKDREITFDIIGPDKNEHGVENRIRMKVTKWDESEIQDTINLNVYSTTREVYMTYPIKIDIPRTEKTIGKEKVQVIINDNYSGSVLNKLTLDGPYNNPDYPDKNTYNLIDIGGNVAGVLIADDDFDPIRKNNVDGNALRGAVNFKIDDQTFTTGGYYKDGAIQIAFGFEALNEKTNAELYLGVGTVTGGFSKDFTLEFENDYGVVVAQYDFNVKTKSYTSDLVKLNFGDISPANKFFETATETTVQVDPLIPEIKAYFSKANTKLVLDGDLANFSTPEKTLDATLSIRSISKDRITAGKWNINLIGRLKPITVADRKVEGQYFNSENITLIVEIPDVSPGTRKIKK